ncbi:acetyl/propionyl/methylcrotonyl-CoA carboxylase subunit alpha [Chromobacterium violaceum]|uniref:Probable acyl-coA carboxylase subunit n=1 Tax=Chromobacterium violaceum (strain ATCC 12472 / DSM 30191 / JCM 1249 / CCUG 213 / NBRC 12614 / NCIMB 9131 / NCTC 9757 / MK) TaxID=243365 RepID=Q7MBF6_CHRVO|nr:acetyl/propionyl/methylcrotonyl-CoA carboxylase subunit alpha [Chromobacterium violaceum]AAQ59436.1 probable acyl-coA carboxylase subunit [Chromobacterium violaceum ATCC 12472]SUX83649.1 Acetyl-/propionyl-coenzyme A carboxylase alpha chain [Chromobacterium violaceum]
MFNKILIANRGEIACRVIKTAKALGIATVAVYSDADANARFVKLADEAYRLGPAPAAESYLRADLILAIARQSGAQAVHPGYGFLSENEDFAAACEAAGIAFIGPPASAIAAMGSKSAAKALMEKAGVPLVPGYHGDEQDPALLQQQADAIGYPVLIKASAGGGGKGMRIVEQAGDFSAALASCQREARASFGDDKVLVEKYLTRPRHVEIQVFADKLGGCVYLFERDCSVQRRHQKVLEEAPAPHLPQATREAMGQAAVAAARAVGYVGAGTVEFIMDVDTGKFYFMEMNTRLQVEHPVTEMITGQDLVAWQLAVAAGGALPLAQEQLAMRGHAIEARIYAEDPDKGFLPSTGTLAHLATPAESAHVRIDTGVEQGDAISPFYDPMIAKLIVWGETREAALRQMDAALAQYRIVGLSSNVSFLRRIVNHPSFASGQVDTGLIARHHDALLPPPAAPTARQLALLALAEALAHPAAYPAPAGWRLNGRLTRRFAFQRDDEDYGVELQYQDDGCVVRVGTESFHARASLAGNQLEAVLNGLRVKAVIVRHGARRALFEGGERLSVDFVDPYAYTELGVHGETHLKAPMPGRVVALLAEIGKKVAKGSPLLILEAMKMEHTITAPGDGVVQDFYFAAGEQVNDGDELVDFAAE